MSECSFWPVALIACLLLASCEGATYLNHHLTNDTSDTLRVGFRTEESTSGWHVDTVWVLAPGETHVHYAVDLRGKCHDCTPYEALPYGIDSMWVDNRTLAVDRSILPFGKCMWTKASPGFVMTSTSTSYLPTLIELSFF